MPTTSPLLYLLLLFYLGLATLALAVWFGLTLRQDRERPRAKAARGKTAPRQRTKRPPEPSKEDLEAAFTPKPEPLLGTKEARPASRRVASRARSKTPDDES